MCECITLFRSSSTATGRSSASSSSASAVADVGLSAGSIYKVYKTNVKLLYNQNFIEIPNYSRWIAGDKDKVQIITVKMDIHIESLDASTPPQSLSCNLNIFPARFPRPKTGVTSWGFPSSVVNPPFYAAISPCLLTNTIFFNTTPGGTIFNGIIILDSLFVYTTAGIPYPVLQSTWPNCLYFLTTTGGAELVDSTVPNGSQLWNPFFITERIPDGDLDGVYQYYSINKNTFTSSIQTTTTEFSGQLPTMVAIASLAGSVLTVSAIVASSSPYAASNQIYSVLVNGPPPPSTYKTVTINGFIQITAAVNSTTYTVSNPMNISFTDSLITCVTYSTNNTAVFSNIDDGINAPNGRCYWSDSVSISGFPSQGTVPFSLSGRVSNNKCYVDMQFWNPAFSLSPAPPPPLPEAPDASFSLRISGILTCNTHPGYGQIVIPRIVNLDALT